MMVEFRPNSHSWTIKCFKDLHKMFNKNDPGKLCTSCTSHNKIVLVSFLSVEKDKFMIKFRSNLHFCFLILKYLKTCKHRKLL